MGAQKSRPPAPNNNNQPRATAHMQAWQGPLPPPGALAQFDEIIPNGAERIMVMCEKEQAGRLAVEDRESRLRFMSIMGGKLVGAVALLTCIGAALWAIHMKADWEIVVAFLSLPLLTVVGKLITDYTHRR